MPDYRDLVIEDAVSELVETKATLADVIAVLADEAFDHYRYQRLAEQFLRELVLERVRFAALQTQIATLMGVE